MSKVIPYGRQEITEEDIKAVITALKSDFLTQGPAVLQFETDFAKFIGSTYALAVNNATSALHLCALALGVKPGQKILCTPNTFVASTNCILYCGAEVEFVDIHPTDFCIDLKALDKKLSAAAPGTYAGVVVVDFAGYAMNLEELAVITEKHGIWSIEDACHGPGAEFQDSQGKWHKSGAGEFTDLATFSFHPVKHIATGEGGMITTCDQELFEKIKLLRTHGITKDPKEMSQVDGGWDMEMKVLGYNYRIPDVLCALGSSQLTRIDKNLQRRREIADLYNKEFADLPLKTPSVPESVKHAYHLYVIQTDHRKELYDYLKTQSIYPQVHYIPIHTQPYYIEKYGQVSMPLAEKYYQGALSLPMFHSMTDVEQRTVIEAVRKFYAGKK